MRLLRNVISPCPGRRLKGIVSVPEKGRFLCRHKYSLVGSHKEDFNDGTEPPQADIRHYACLKCHRLVHVYGPTDMKKILEVSRKLSGFD